MSMTENSRPDDNPQPYHLPTDPAHNACSCGQITSTGQVDPDIHDAWNVAAAALVRIADKVDELAGMNVGGIMGALFGGKGR